MQSQGFESRLGAKCAIYCEYVAQYLFSVNSTGFAKVSKIWFSDFVLLALFWLKIWILKSKIMPEIDKNIVVQQNNLFCNGSNIKYVRIIKECENTETPKFPENTKLSQKSQM